VVVPVPLAGANLGWLRRARPEPRSPQDGRPPPNMPPQPIPSREAREALVEARRIISQRKSAELWRWLDQRKGA
jgi:hypothetical protein